MIQFKKSINHRFNNVRQDLLRRNKKHVCMYPNCSEEAVNSHSISKEKNLSLISENGNLFTLTDIRDDLQDLKNIEFKSIGVNQATTFKGFCKTHEGIFKSVDTEGITTYRDVFLQTYRSTSRSLFKSLINSNAEKNIASFNLLYEDPMNEKKTLSAHKISKVMYEKIADENNFIYPLAVNGTSAISVSSDICSFYILHKKIYFKCPVALETRFSLGKKIGEQYEEYNSFLIFIPSSSGGDLIIVSHNTDINNYKSHLTSELKILNLLESAMIADGDWWIPPSLKNGWKEEKIKLIEDDYWCYIERKFLQPYEISIFDEIRILLCKKAASEEAINELSKINFFPTRKEILERRKSCMPIISFIDNEKL